jgi:hypothetical protein
MDTNQIQDVTESPKEVTNKVSLFFEKLIKTPYALDVVTFVKKIDNKFLIVIDRKGCGYVLDVETNYSPLYDFHQYDHHGATITGLIYYKDVDGQEMLIISTEHCKYIECISLENRRRSVRIIGHDCVVGLDKDKRPCLIQYIKDNNVFVSKPLEFEWRKIRVDLEKNCFEPIPL